MAEVEQISAENLATQEVIKESAEEIGFKLGAVVCRGATSAGETRLSHWLEPGRVVALEAQLDIRAMEELYAAAEAFPDRVIEAVSGITDVPIARILGPGKRVDEVAARQAAIHIIRKRTSLSSTEIGQLFNRDHSTILYAVQKVEELLNQEKWTPTGKTTVLIKQVESKVAEFLRAVKDTVKDDTPEGSLDAVTITRDGLHAYPAIKIKPMYLKALRIRDPDTLVLNYDKRLVTDELFQRYGELALCVVSDLKT